MFRSDLSTGLTGHVPNIWENKSDFSGKIKTSP